MSWTQGLPDELTETEVSKKKLFLTLFHAWMGVGWGSIVRGGIKVLAAYIYHIPCLKGKDGVKGPNKGHVWQLWKEKGLKKGVSQKRGRPKGQTLIRQYGCWPKGLLPRKQTDWSPNLNL